jgi:hypothetical protein
MYAGLKLFTMGKGDDLSGWEVIDLTINIHQRSFSEQFEVSTCLTFPRVPTVHTILFAMLALCTIYGSVYVAVMWAVMPV